jgi:hypothetical protein
MTKTLIDHAVDRFLGWKLPKDFNPDCGITFDPEKLKPWPGLWPVGTNLLTAIQAKVMLEHALNGLVGWQPIETAPTDGTVIDLYVDWAESRELDCHWDGTRWVNWGRDGFESPGWEEVHQPSHWMPRPAGPAA